MIKDFLNSIKVKFETKTASKEIESPYNPEFVAKIKKAEAAIKKGNTTRLNPNDIWGSIL